MASLRGADPGAPLEGRVNAKKKRRAIRYLREVPRSKQQMQQSCPVSLVPNLVPRQVATPATRVLRR